MCMAIRGWLNVRALASALCCVTSLAMRRVASLSLLIALPVLASSSSQLPLAADLSSDARVARERGAPILILYSLPGCSACETIRRSHLLPLLKDGKANVIVRQVDLNSRMTLKDFAGKATTHGDYAQTQGLRFAPVVKLVGPDGNALTAPLTGTLLPDFYAAYLDDAIAAARAKLKAAS
jgi:hypothetical protein